MLRFEDSTRSEAPPEEVWKALYDPTRFTEWWQGMETGEVGDGEFVFYQTGVPDLPIPNQLRVHNDEQRVVVSCLLHDLVFTWQLEPLDGGRATQITVHVEIPDDEAARFDTQRQVISRSIRRLAQVATS
jgi:uncharacterized protein YndB with AHSA1/START domain